MIGQKFHAACSLAWSLPSLTAVFLIRAYQKTLSPDHSFWAKAMDRPPYCKHVPSCSQYGVEAFEKKGFIVGLLKTSWRVLRCNPWTKGGYDPVDPPDAASRSDE